MTGCDIYMSGVSNTHYIQPKDLAYYGSSNNEGINFCWMDFS